ncbi:MAG: hypothetical protein U0414_35430 [Polyangiaceae bacterium]
MGALVAGSAIMIIPLGVLHAQPLGWIAFAVASVTMTALGFAPPVNDVRMRLANPPIEQP